MELEEAIKFLEKLNNTIKENKLFFNDDNIQVKLGIKISEAVEIVLKELQNSIPKKKIEDRIKELEHLIEEVKDVVGLGFDCIEYKGAIKILQELLEDK